MLSIQRRGTGVMLTWCLIGVSVLYVMYTAGRSALTGILNV